MVLTNTIPLAQQVDILQEANTGSREPLPQSRQLTVDLPPSSTSDQAGADSIRINHGSTEGALVIELNRTIRVPDNKDTNMLPPGLGHFPLFKVQDYASRMPDDMAAKGGLFFPMYQREAMWINFRARAPFALKIYVGGVNAVSGLPMEENERTQQKRLRMLKDGKPIQDYMVVPGQRWLDGIVSEDGKIRQFVAKPKGSGFSVEVQVTGEEKVGGIQVEVIPVKYEVPEEVDVRYENKKHQVIKRTLNFAAKGLDAQSSLFDLRKVLRDEFDVAIQDQHLEVQPYDPQIQGDISTMGDSAKTVKLGGLYLKSSSLLRLSHVEPIAPAGQFRTMASMQSMPFAGAMLASAPPPAAPMMKCAMTSSSGFGAGAGAGNPFSPVARDRRSAPRGAAPKRRVKELGLAAGGLIQQTIEPDPHPAGVWDTAAAILLNLQILDSEAFAEVTGAPPPPTPIDAQTYATHGFPFFEVWGEEKTGVRGDFGEVRSVAQIEAAQARERGETAEDEEPSVPQKVRVIGRFTTTFRPVEVLKKELEGLKLDE
ncbi:uncharacterized protein JN550_000734 [Neoarthrinium moseri]|uniref:uncharacterized protein n=1 Tax=Neoarthrinium moseri TaxID=1658444 RepID=UPI001FDCCF8F|nr:uncharacterized protein JN550_000734 [Neoarthrinium moseri]KAI1878552.1 hypothetical protein JN550_000734 [Neoarthrinium moseri]